MSRLTLPYRECPECHCVHAAHICHICKTPIAAVPLDEPAPAGTREAPLAPPPTVVVGFPAGAPSLRPAGFFRPRRAA